MLSITLAILALYVLELMKMAVQPRVAFVYFAISISLAISAVVFAAWREIIREG